jgi:hypothetical protein
MRKQFFAMLVSLGVGVALIGVWFLRLYGSRTLIAEEIEARGGSVEGMRFRFHPFRAEYEVRYFNRTGERRTVNAIEYFFKVFFADDRPETETAAGSQDPESRGKIQEQIGQPDRPTAAGATESAEVRCPQCSAVVNYVTGYGMHSPACEPWLLICDKCGATIEPEP